MHSERYTLGDRTDNIVTMSRDLETGEIKEHYSMAECARYIGVSNNELHKFMSKPVNKYPLAEKWDAVRKGKEWSDLSEKDLGKTWSPRSKMILTMVKGKDGKFTDVTLYTSLSDYSFLNGVDIKTAIEQLNTNIIDEEKGLYMFGYTEYKDKATLEISVTKSVEFKPKTRARGAFLNKPTPIRLTNMTNGASQEFESAEEVAKLLGVKKKTVQNYISSLGGIVQNLKLEYIK